MKLFRQRMDIADACAEAVAQLDVVPENKPSLGSRCQYSQRQRCWGIIADLLDCVIYHKSLEEMFGLAYLLCDTIEQHADPYCHDDAAIRKLRERLDENRVDSDAEFRGAKRDRATTC